MSPVVKRGIRVRTRTAKTTHQCVVVRAKISVGPQPGPAGAERAREGSGPVPCSSGICGGSVTIGSTLVRDPPTKMVFGRLAARLGRVAVPAAALMCGSAAAASVRAEPAVRAQEWDSLFTLGQEASIAGRTWLSPTSRMTGWMTWEGK